MTSPGESILPIIPLLESAGVHVLSLDSGYVTCPGVDFHTNRNAESDCRAFNNEGVPRLYCYHQSCASIVEAKNRELYSAWRHWSRHCGAGGEVAYDRAQWAQAQARRKELEDLEQQAQNSLPTIIRDYAWPYAAIAADSPEPISPELPEYAYRHAKTGAYYAVKKIAGKLKERNLQTADRKIAKRRFKE